MEEKVDTGSSSWRAAAACPTSTSPASAGQTRCLLSAAALRAGLQQKQISQASRASRLRDRVRGCAT